MRLFQAGNVMREAEDAMRFARFFRENAGILLAILTALIVLAIGVSLLEDIQSDTTTELWSSFGPPWPRTVLLALLVVCILLFSDSIKTGVARRNQFALAIMFVAGAIFGILLTTIWWGMG